MFGFFFLSIWLLLVSIFDSFVSTGVSLEMATVVVKEESDDPDYYQYTIPGNDTNFHVCLSHERFNCLSVIHSVPLFLLILVIKCAIASLC